MRMGLVSLLVAAAVAAGVLLWTGGTSTVDEPDIEPELQDPGTELVGRKPDVEPPAAPPKPVDPSVEEKLAAQRKENIRRGRPIGVQRKSVVRRLYRNDIREPSYVPDLVKFIDESPAGYEYTKAMSMVVVMRTEESRRYLAQLAKDLARQYRDRQGFATMLHKVDPEVGGAILRAFTLALRDSTGRGLSQDLSALAELLAANPKKGREALSEALERAHGTAAYAWLDVARYLNPVPRAFAATWLAAFTSARDNGLSPYLTLLEPTGLAWSPHGVGAAVADTIVRSWGRLPTSDHRIALQALGRLGSGSPVVVDHLVAQVRATGERMAIHALGDLGPEGARSVLDLVGIAKRDRPYLAPEISAALVRMRDGKALPFLGQRLLAGESKERIAIAKVIHEIPGAETLRDVLLGEVERLNINATRALALLDRDVEEPETLAGFKHAFHLSDRHPAIAKAGYEATKLLTEVPDELLIAMIDGLRSAKALALRTGVNALADVGRLGARTRRWTTRLLDESRRAERSGPPEIAYGVLSIAGENAGDDPAVRARLFEIIDTYAPEGRARGVGEHGVHMLKAALRGLAGVEDPTKDQFLAVARLRTSRVGRGYELMSPAYRVMANPSWHRILGEHGIRLSMEVRIGVPKWR